MPSCGGKPTTASLRSTDGAADLGSMTHEKEVASTSIASGRQGDDIQSTMLLDADNEMGFLGMNDTATRTRCMFGQRAIRNDYSEMEVRYVKRPARAHACPPARRYLGAGS